MNKRLLNNLASAVVLILLLVSTVEANEDVADKMSLVDLQKLILSEISQAKNHGVGIKPYEDALVAVNASFDDGVEPDKIRQRYDSILSNLKNQNKEASLFRTGKQRRVLTTAERQWGEFSPLMHAIQRKIKSNWRPAISDKNQNFAVLFELMGDGQIRNLKVSKSSGDSDSDEIGLEAVRKSVPFQRPPSNMGFETKGLWIEFNFDYNAVKSKRQQ